MSETYKVTGYAAKGDVDEVGDVTDAEGIFNLTAFLFDTPEALAADIAEEPGAYTDEEAAPVKVSVTIEVGE